MARRKELKNIAYGLLNSFTSRNNDVDGYWGIGKFYALMEHSNNYKIEIDLISKYIKPPDKEFKRLIEEYSNPLLVQLQNRRLKIEYLKLAKIILSGYPNEPTPAMGLTAPHRIHCVFELIDDLGIVHKAENETWCRKHDPKKELKSSRKH